MTTIPIFFTIDFKAPLYLDCAIRSVIMNSSRDYHYIIYVLYESLPESDIESLKLAAEPPFEIEFVQMEENFAGIENRPENRLRCDFFTPSIFYRLFIADRFPMYDKGIYLDGDVIVNGDISELYQKDLSDNIIAACPDFSIRQLPEFVSCFEDAVGIPINEYVNSGVLLMNLKKMREMKFSDHFLNLMNTYHFDSIAPDQDYINAMCYGKILFLDESWDAMPPVGGGRELIENPNLIHYNLFWKPWCYDDIPYEDYFWKVAKTSPAYENILDYKAKYSDEKKESDQVALERMCTNAAGMKDKEVTFKKVYESGAPVRL